MCQDENENIGGKPKLWFILELMHDKQTDPSMYRSTEAFLSQALSRTNENFRLRVHFRPGTRTDYK